MQKTLITGATGHLGGSVVDYLLERNGPGSLAVLSRHPDGNTTAGFRDRGLDVRIGDYDKPEELASAFDGIEVLYFVSSSDVENRLKQHENVVSAAQRASVKHIIYTSSVRETEGPETVLHPIVDAHKQTEDRIMESGMDYTILRHNLYAEVAPLFIGDREQLLGSKTVYLPAGDGRVALAPRRDLAEAAAILLADPAAYRNRVLSLNGSERVTFSEVATMLGDILDTKIDYVSPGREEFRKTMKTHGVPEGAIWMTDIFSTGIAEGEFAGPSDELEKILGRKTSSLQDFFRETYA
ncbi:NAD(P)H dehydrogenase (quinone) [Neolewinella xylanilytica]|uniref:NAD(P)H dehydrogenase (Quinone) n=1 Tax=Neolewinella xylanilytica TaxID=1514080 RepID=A0A2S6IAB6_9BACT|nr:NmrA family NAD(P)-binding protein [Neolewinella xylanilytica]PPK88444.1 NAD(P)H dehydrogenase (quinone) [Neolewinella xylanilytica]